MHAVRRVVVAVVATAAAAAAAVVPSASATTTVPGHDYSWPQCARGVGNGQGHPLPTGTHAFAIVGLTNGTGLHENPCLAGEWSYARSHASYVTGYAIVTYPTRAQLAAARHGHYGACSTLVCELKNNGWAQGEFTDTSLRRIGAHPPLVWIDVETRAQQPWSGTRSRNSVVVKAVIASLQAHGLRVGIYSNHYLWNHIAGFRTSLPEWVPAASLTKGCRMPFAGGPVWLSQWSHTYTASRSFDENAACRGVPSITSWLARSHPTALTYRAVQTGALGVRFDGGRQLSLSARSAYPAAVVTVPSAAGGAPVFAATGADGQVQIRTLASSWQPLGPAACAGAPALAVSDRSLVVSCSDSGGSAVATSLALDSDGAPYAAAPSTVAHTG
jgi:hypothetical protein